MMSEKLQNGPEPAEFLLYQTEDGQTRLEVRLQEETVWLTQKRMAELFQKNVQTVNEHIQNIFDEGEVIPESVIRNFRITAEDGKRYNTQHYNSEDGQVRFGVAFHGETWWPSLNQLAELFQRDKSVFPGILKPIRGK